jgi:cyclohexyl-isocyanide hydratase
MIIFPGLTQLDLTGPYDVLTRVPGAKVLLIAETKSVVKSDAGLVLTPDATFADCPQADILFVPGGRGVFEAIQNKRLISFLQKQAPTAKYVTSVCTGALVLAAAGLLNGHKATTHWLSLHLLRLFGVDVVEERVVIDRNRITGGGVTAGIDFGLYLAGLLAGGDAAKEIQLMMEYNPAPPFNAGSPQTAGEDIVKKVINARADVQKQREVLIKSLAG